MKRQKINLKLSKKEIGDLYDIMYMVCDNCIKVIKLNKADKSFKNIHKKIEKIVIPELYKK